MEQQIREAGSTAQGIEDVEDLYPEELYEADWSCLEYNSYPFSPEMRIGKDD